MQLNIEISITFTSKCIFLYTCVIFVSTGTEIRDSCHNLIVKFNSRIISVAFVHSCLNVIFGSCGFAKLLSYFGVVPHQQEPQINLCSLVQYPSRGNNRNKNNDSSLSEYLKNELCFVNVYSNALTACLFYWYNNTSLDDSDCIYVTKLC